MATVRRTGSRRRHARARATRIEGPARVARAAADRGHRLRHRHAARRPTTRTGRMRSSTRTSCGRAPPAAPAWSSARSTSSTSTPSSTCGATRPHRVGVPRELGGLFKNLENKGNPWGMAARARLDWAKDLPFPVKILGQDVESADATWTTCSGSAAPAPTRTGPRRRPGPWPSCSTRPACRFAVLGDGESCTGDSARRAGNEFLFQMLAQQNVETLNEVGATKIVVTCAHCFNTIKNEYPQLGGKYEVVHHTQLLNRLVREKKLVPVARPATPRQSRQERRLDRRDRHLPRPLLPRPAQRRLRPAARAHRRAARRRAQGDGAHQGEVVLLRRRRCAHVDGGEARHPDQHQPHRGGHRHRRRADRHRLPVLPGDDLRRPRPPSSPRARPEEVEVVDVAQMLLAAVRRGQRSDDGAPVDAGGVAEDAGHGGSRGHRAGGCGDCRRRWRLDCGKAGRSAGAGAGCPGRPVGRAGRRCSRRRDALGRARGGPVGCARRHSSGSSNFAGCGRGRPLGPACGRRGGRSAGAAGC